MTLACSAVLTVYVSVCVNHMTDVQVGPRLSFQSAWSTNAVSICRSCGLDAIPRLEVSRRFLLRSKAALPAETVAVFAAMVRTRHTQVSVRQQRAPKHLLVQ